jgi:hypothetical protein
MNGHVCWPSWIHQKTICGTQLCQSKVIQWSILADKLPSGKFFAEHAPQTETLTYFNKWSCSTHQAASIELLLVKISYVDQKLFNGVFLHRNSLSLNFSQKMHPRSEILTRFNQSLFSACRATSIEHMHVKIGYANEKLLSGLFSKTLALGSFCRNCSLE